MEKLPEIFCPAVLEGSIVRLNLLAEKDFERLFAAASDPLIWEQHPAKDRYREEKFRKYFLEALETGSSFLAEDRISGKVIGSTRYYEYSPETDSVCIGYTFLTREFWGGSYNREMKTLMLDFAFQHISRVLFHISADNHRSYRACEKMGARRIREFQKESGEVFLPYFEYEIRREDWDGNEQWLGKDSRQGTDDLSIKWRK